MPENTKSEHAVVCPHCGHFDDDTFNYDHSKDFQRRDCVECGKPFMLQITRKTIYTTDFA